MAGKKKVKEKKKKVQKPEPKPEPELIAYNMTFVHDYAVVIVREEGINEQEAIMNAVAMIEGYYGWDLSSFSVEGIEELE
jgi:hypothetical protein